MWLSTVSQATDTRMSNHRVVVLLITLQIYSYSSKNLALENKIVQVCDDIYLMNIWKTVQYVASYNYTQEVNILATMYNTWPIS